MMAAKYAKSQPAGYTNHIQNVAIVGAGGQSGKFMVEELLKTGKHHVRAITRPESTNQIASGVEIKKVNYDDAAGLAEALRGQDILIITLYATAPEDLQPKLIEAAAAADVPFVMPNWWGGDYANTKLGEENFLGPRAKPVRDLVEKLGKSAWINLCCGFWYQYSLSFGDWCYGFNLVNRKVTLYDDGKTRLNTSTWPQVGRAVAKLVSLKILPDDEHDESPHLSQFSNGNVFVSSFCLNQREMLDSVQRVTGTNDKDWTILYQPTRERYEEGMKILKTGNRQGFGQLLYARAFYPEGDGNFEAKRGLQNNLLGLPKEDLDAATKVAVQMAEDSASS